MIGAVGQAGRQKITWMVRCFQKSVREEKCQEEGGGEDQRHRYDMLGAGVAFYIFEYTQKIGATQAEMGGRKIFRITGIYSGVQLLMLIFGISIVEIIRISGFERNAAKWYHALATAVLLIYAFSCVRMAFYGKGMEEHLEPGTRYRLADQSVGPRRNQNNNHQHAGLVCEQPEFWRDNNDLAAGSCCGSGRSAIRLLVWLKMEQADLFCRRRISFDIRHAHGGDTICIADRRQEASQQERGGK